ncbi:IreB family regulatory phosphoprotein [Dethiosulfatibacter aminovorans]|uniref:IreB family regulatory phosphoprotein n=1 Tax=Dethiosulfatibacter aminovorans TaxID=332095 RepID=UPI000932E2EA|nr:IreB family regulatory phosphoprotein [Dethiosulfatibacter aminovorans]
MVSLDNKTTQFDFGLNNVNEVKEIIKSVLNALNEKGYNPVSQIIGYILSGDPTYITSHNNARSIIMKVERDELLEEILNDYLENLKNE